MALCNSRTSLLIHRPLSFQHERSCRTLRRRSTNCSQHTRASLQLRLGTAILVSREQKPALSCLTTRLRPRILLPHDLTPDDCSIQSP